MPNFFDPRAPVEATAHNLPHWQQSDTWVFLTFRLADSVPAEKLAAWESDATAWRAHHPPPWDEATATEYQQRFLEPFDSWLDRGTGTCLLRDPANRKFVTQAFHHFDRQRYAIASYVIMPNHVHVLFAPHPDQRLADIVHSWKSFSARQINTRESRTGTPLWQPDYYDRLIRSQDHFAHTLTYIANNPKNLPPSNYTLYTT